MTDLSEPTLGPTGHLTPEQLDDLAAQASADIDPDQPAVNRGPGQVLGDHLSGCATCRSALGDQIAVRGWLQRVPGPGPMPSDVTARLDAALVGARSDPPRSADVLPLRTESSRTGPLGRLLESRTAKTLVAAAAIGLIGLGAYAALQNRGDSSNSAGSSAKAPASAGAADQRSSVAGGGLDAAAAAARASGTAYTRANIDAEVTRQLAVPASQFKPPADAPNEAKASPLTTPAGLHACLAALGYPSVTPLLVDLATYDGKPAAVLVLPGDATGKQIWVVSPTCTTGADGTAFYGVLP